MHRAFHALPPLTGRDGQPTNAVYGFISMLFRIIEDLKPTHLAVAFDRPEPTFRKLLFAAYQATRPHMDDTLSSQFPIVRDVMTAMHIPIYEKAGFEADDVLGTIAKKIKEQKVKSKNTDQNVKMETIIIVTGDRDMLQLVDENIRLYMPIGGLANAKLFTISDVKEKYGVNPWQFVDYKALIGDASDNYPGVSGIGPKTAATLLVKHKTLDTLYKEMDTESPRMVEKLTAGKENVTMARKLAAINPDVDIDIDVEGMKVEDINTPECRELFEKIGFNTLLKRLKGEKVEREKKDKMEKKEEVKKKQDENQLSLL